MGMYAPRFAGSYPGRLLSVCPHRTYRAVQPVRTGRFAAGEQAVDLVDQRLEAERAALARTGLGDVDLGDHPAGVEPSTRTRPASRTASSISWVTRQAAFGGEVGGAPEGAVDGFLTEPHGDNGSRGGASAARISPWMRSAIASSGQPESIRISAANPRGCQP